MSDLQERFDAAVADSKTLTKNPGNDTLLQLYALFKQSTKGDVSGKRPGMMKMVDRAKYDAWANLKGQSADNAKETYIGVIEDLKAQE